MHERFLVWGAGGQGKVIGDLIRELGNVLVGYIDRDPGRGRALEAAGFPAIVATDAEVRTTLRGGHPLPDGASMLGLGVGDNQTRLEFSKIVPDARLPALVHPSATVSSSVVLGSGTVVMAHGVINPSAAVGRAAIVNTASIVEHDCFVGDGAHISPGAVLSGGARVGQAAWIGAGAVVLPGVTIGAGAIVGAGAVVTQSVSDGQTVAGVPARLLTP